MKLKKRDPYLEKGYESTATFIYVTVGTVYFVGSAFAIGLGIASGNWWPVILMITHTIAIAVGATILIALIETKQIVPYYIDKEEEGDGNKKGENKGST